LLAAAEWMRTSSMFIGHAHAETGWIEIAQMMFAFLAN